MTVWSKPQSQECSARAHSRRFRGQGLGGHTDYRVPKSMAACVGKPIRFAISALTASWYYAEIARTMALNDQSRGFRFRKVLFGYFLFKEKVTPRSHGTGHVPNNTCQTNDAITRNVARTAMSFLAIQLPLTEAANGGLRCAAFHPLPLAPMFQPDNRIPLIVCCWPSLHGSV